MYYNYSEELDKIAKELKKLENDKKPVKNWQKQSYGSAMCYGTSMRNIYDAYMESKQYNF